jgi:hypothetical protein
MRCVCCNKVLNDYESTIKSISSGEYLDTCLSCLDGLNIPYTGNKDFNMYESFEEEEVLFLKDDHDL